MDGPSWEAAPVGRMTAIWIGGSALGLHVGRRAAGGRVSRRRDPGRSRRSCRGQKYYRRGLWDRDPELEISDEERHGDALSRARRTRSEQEDETATLDRTFARDAARANEFSKLSRYETTIERQVYRSLHELERRQAGRSCAAPTPPQVLALGGRRATSRTQRRPKRITKQSQTLDAPAVARSTSQPEGSCFGPRRGLPCPCR
jgi:hypothetical protein